MSYFPPFDIQPAIRDYRDPSTNVRRVAEPNNGTPHSVKQLSPRKNPINLLRESSALSRALSSRKGPIEVVMVIWRICSGSL
ncbi:hypothetical protein PISMIDRAFT_539411 [Pisolithus microcarpus 441]|uniref:Uncharacterized protein n=1 Tax=Pisolithus microcarpus 441 TaxID=765257 RepID=A0A0C9Z5Q6_9AGAM|nr:hypothetical protein PISMIDRAFT_539411 [Pisolithus microcarpus 441]